MSLLMFIKTFRCILKWKILFNQEFQRDRDKGNNENTHTQINLYYII